MAAVAAENRWGGAKTCCLTAIFRVHARRKHEHEKATLIVIEARGCEPVESSLEGLTFTGTTPTGETVEIELEEEGEWYGATESGDELAVAESLCKWELAAAPAGRKGKK